MQQVTVVCTSDEQLNVEFSPRLCFSPVAWFPVATISTLGLFKVDGLRSTC